jgi:hypothetical protein
VLVEKLATVNVAWAVLVPTDKPVSIKANVIWVRNHLFAFIGAVLIEFTKSVRCRLEAWVIKRNQMAGCPRFGTAFVLRRNGE